jgi:hypothetical protein
MSNPESGYDQAMADAVPEIQKTVGKRKLRQHAKKALDKAREAKREAVKKEKKALKQLAEAERHLTKAAAKRAKAEEHLAKFTQRTQVALQAFELVKTEYDILKNAEKAKPAAEKPSGEDQPAQA